MIPLLLAALLSATGQKVGTESPTSDVSNRRVTATGSATSRALKDRAADVVNVKDFGAKGDGVTDDGAAIIDALNAVSTAGTTVYFPAGTYITATPIVAPAGASIRGAGGVARGYDTVLAYGGASGRGSRLYYTGVGTALTLGGYSRVEGLAVQANSGSGITLQDARMTHLLDVAVSAGGDKGIFLASTDGNKGTGWCSVTSFNVVAPRPIVIQPTAPGWTNFNTFSHGIARTNADANTISINGAHNTTFNHVDASYYGTATGVAAFNIYGSSIDVNLNSVYVEAPLTSNYIGLSIADGSGSVKWIGGFNGAQTPVNDGSGAANNVFWWFTTGSGATTVPKMTSLNVTTLGVTTVNATTVSNVSSAAVSVFTSPCVASAGANMAPTQYLKPTGEVRLAGRVKSSSGTITAGTALFTLDAAYRPNHTVRMLTVNASGVSQWVSVDTSGIVAVGADLVAGSAELHLDGIAFQKTN